MSPLLAPEQIDDLTQHPGFEALSRRIEQMIEDHRSALEQDIAQEATWKVRGAVAALRRVLELPKILREEAERGTATREPRRPHR